MKLSANAFLTQRETVHTHCSVTAINQGLSLLPLPEALKHLLQTQQLPAPRRSAAGFCGSVTAKLKTVTAEKRSKISQREGRT